MPEPLLPVAIVAKSKADEDKLSQALARLVAEDPTLRLENNAETRQLVLWCMGEAHADLLLDRLAHRVRRGGGDDRRCGCRCGRRSRGKAQGLGRNVKQTGGHGEFGDLPHRGRAAGRPAAASSSSTRSSAAWCRGSSSPRWRRASAAQMEQGVRGRLPDGRTSGSRCTTARRTRWTPPTWPSRRPAGPRCGTPWTRPRRCCSSRSTRCRVLVADDYVGAVMSDLSSRRGRVLGTEPVGRGPDPGQGRDPGARDHPVRDRPAVDVPRHRLVHPLLPAPRAAARPTWPSKVRREAEGRLAEQ